MSTTAKHQPIGQVETQRTELPSPERPSRPLSRPPGRLLFILRHPIDFFWGWLSSVRNAIAIITLIVGICLLGVYFPQAPAEVLNDPAGYSFWIQQNVLTRYGSMTPVYDWLQFFKIFSSWYFYLLMFLLAMSTLVGGLLNRAPTIWHNFAHPLLRRSDKFYQNALERGEYQHPEAVEWTRQALRRRHYRVRSLVERSEDHSSVTFLYANKNSWATLSTFVFHISLVSLMLAGLLSQWHGFAPGSPARSILPGPLVALSDSLASLTFDQALAQGESAVVYPRGTLHNISFRSNRFTAKFDPQTGLATDYVTDLSVYRDGEQVAHSDHLRVNDPLAYGGIVFHQSSLIPSVDVTVTDRQGIVYSGPVVLDQNDSSGGVSFDYGDMPLSGSQAGANLVLRVIFLHDRGSHISEVQNPRLLLSIGPANTDFKQSKALIFLRPGETKASPDRYWQISMQSAQDATVLLVTKDIGSGLVWPISVILILSLCITFYFPQKRIWLRIEGDRVQMAALREHFTNIRIDLLGITREAQKESVDRPQPLTVGSD